MKKNIEALTQEFLKERLKDPEYQKHYREEKLRQHLGESIAALRKKKKMSVDEFAKKIGTSSQNVTRMEKGEYGRYTLKTILGIAQETDTYVHIGFSGEP
jgi:DNA-binding transcriptional regulator YiaG